MTGGLTAGQGTAVGHPDRQATPPARLGTRRTPWDAAAWTH